MLYRQIVSGRAGSFLDTIGDAELRATLTRPAALGLYIDREAFLAEAIARNLGKKRREFADMNRVVGHLRGIAASVRIEGARVVLEAVATAGEPVFPDLLRRIDELERDRILEETGGGTAP